MSPWGSSDRALVLAFSSSFTLHSNFESCAFEPALVEIVMDIDTAAATPAVVVAKDLLVLNISVATAHRLLHKLGAVRVGARARRLPVERLRAGLGDELAAVVLSHLKAR